MTNPATTTAHDCKIDLIAFDYGGVLASEGFRDGLAAIADKNDLDRKGLFDDAVRIIHGCGYTIGETDETSFWRAFKFETGVQGTPEELRRELLSGFVLRGWMFDVVAKLKMAGLGLAVVSDQTNWLDELEAKQQFFSYFDVVINSYHYGMSKMSADTFPAVAKTLGVPAQRILFVDDTESHTWRAKQAGMKAIWYRDREEFMRELRFFCPFLGS